MKKSIVYATDENYWMPLYVSLYSLLDNNSQSAFDIYILSKERDTEFFEHTNYLNAVHDDFTIEFVEVDESDFASAPNHEWFNEGIYYRLRMDSLVPTDGNVLYLDCDTLVTGSVEGLFETDLSGFIAAATPEMINKAFWIGLPVDAHFYNTGVMYIDLSSWRAHNIETRAVEYIENHGELRLPVQEILNSLLHTDDAWTGLNPKYNSMVGSWLASDVAANWNRAVDPRIIHYFGGAKPWEHKSMNRYKKMWLHYLGLTPYRDYDLNNIRL